MKMRKSAERILLKKMLIARGIIGLFPVIHWG